MNENIDKGISSLQKRVYWTVPMMLSYHCFRIKYDFQTDCTKWLMVHIFVFKYIISDHNHTLCQTEAWKNWQKICVHFQILRKSLSIHNYTWKLEVTWSWSNFHSCCANQNSFKLRLRLICVTRVSIVNSFLTLNHSVYKSNHVKALKICTKFFASTSY